MAARAAVAGRVIGIVGLIAAPVALHLAITRSHSALVVLAIAAVQIAALVLAFGRRNPGAVKWVAAGLAVLLLALIAARTSWGLAAMPGIPHALAYAGLLIAFGS